MSSPTSRPEYVQYSSPTNSPGANAGSQTRGLISNQQMYSPRSKPGGRSGGRNKFIAAVFFLAAVFVIVAHGHYKHHEEDSGSGSGSSSSSTKSERPKVRSSSNNKSIAVKDSGKSSSSSKDTPNSKESKPTVSSPSPYQRYSEADRKRADSFKEPRVAWLMSFPNSGTSYTLRLAQWASKVTAATNYGDECDLDDEGRNVPLYPGMSNAPALKYPQKYSLPTRYALTKTHCGGRCTHCGPDKYVETQQTFHEQCLQGNRMVPLEEGRKPSPQNIRNKGKSERIMEIRYSEDLVDRAVHVIRDPFNNVVARFHLDWGKYNHRADKDEDAKKFVEEFSYDPEGFLKWCKSIDDIYIKEEEKSRFISEEVLELFQQIPCHGDFFRYIQWHNLAVATTAKLDLPTFVLHYENYATEFDKTKDDLMGFLELDIVGEVPEFIPGKSYRNYFTKEQRVAALELMRKMANPEAWELLERYDYDGLSQ